MDLDPLLLSRIQFAFVISFHILFPAFTIGIAAFIALLEGLWLVSRRPIFATLSKFWTHIFAISFGMGVVSGIVMSYQFGTNWSRFTDRTANVLGPLFSYEVLTAFFLEATFLGLLLFGRGRVPHWMIAFSAVMVALGTLVSAFWILAANSWMHTPAGYELRDGVFHVTSWWDAIFNPSFPYRLLHMVTACFLTAGFVVIGVAAWYVLRDRAGGPERLMLSMTVWLMAILVPFQILLGDLHGLNTFEHQPVKVAAMEGHWESQRGAPLILFALPDQEAAENRWEVSVPKLGSLVLTHNWDGQVHGLKDWPADERPRVAIVFWSFRIMVGAGLVMLCLAGWGLYLSLRGRLFHASLFHRLCVWASPIGFLAIIAGWITTEVGRQPWVVYGLMRTADGITPSLEGATVLWSLICYALAYSIIFGAGAYFIVRLIGRGPQREEPETAFGKKDGGSEPAFQSKPANRPVDQGRTGN